MRKIVCIITLLFLSQSNLFSQSSSDTYSENDFKITVLQKGGMFSVAMPPGDMSKFAIELLNDKGKITKDYMSYHKDETHSIVFSAVLPGKYKLRIKKRENKSEKVIATREIEIKEK